MRPASLLPFVSVLALATSCLQKPYRFSAPPTETEDVMRAIVKCGKRVSPILGRTDDALVTLWELSDIPENDPDRNSPRDIAHRYRVKMNATPQGLDLEVRVELGLDRQHLDVKRLDCLPNTIEGTDVWQCATVETRQAAACDKDRNCIGFLEPIQVLPKYEVRQRDHLAQCMREQLAPTPTPP